MDKIEFRNSLAVALSDALSGLLEGAANDVEHFVMGISNDAVIAGSLGRDDLLRELLAQTRLLAELNRLRAVNQAWDTVENVVRAMVAFAVHMAADSLRPEQG